MWYKLMKQCLTTPQHEKQIGYWVSDHMVRERNVLFNKALNTFYLWICGIRHMVKDHSDSERGNPLLSHGLLFPTDRITHTTAFVTPVMEHWLQREMARWVHPMRDRFRRPIAPWVNALTTELHLAPYGTKYQITCYTRGSDQALHQHVDTLGCFGRTQLSDFSQGEQMSHNLIFIGSANWKNVNNMNKTNTPAVWKGRKENVLFNDTLNTFYFYGSSDIW